MGKQVSTFKSSLPPYTSKAGYKWRRQIVSNLNQSKKRPRSGFLLRQKVEVVVLLYLGRRKNSEKQDVDNLLKHILDALQGRFGGPKSRRSKGRIIKNDRQVCRVVIEKQPIPKKYKNREKSDLEGTGGWILVRPYSAHRWPI